MLKGSYSIIPTNMLMLCSNALTYLILIVSSRFRPQEFAAKMIIMFCFCDDLTFFVALSILYLYIGTIHIVMTYKTYETYTTPMIAERIVHHYL